MIRVCLIGCGSIARAAHGPALRRLQAEGAAELLACCSRNPKHAEEFGRTFGFHRFYGDYAEMLRAEKPDAVFCLLPVAQNAACAADVLRRGCAVIMEKPPGVDKREADAITAAAKESGRYHAVLFNRRSMPLVRKAKELLAGETLEAVSLEMCREGRTGEDFTTTAIHGIDCLRFLTGRDYESLTFAYQEDGETACSDCLPPDVPRPGETANAAKKEICVGVSPQEAEYCEIVHPEGCPAIGTEVFA